MVVNSRTRRIYVNNKKNSDLQNGFLSQNKFWSLKPSYFFFFKKSGITIIVYTGKTWNKIDKYNRNKMIIYLLTSLYFKRYKNLFQNCIYLFYLNISTRHNPRDTSSK